MAPNRSAANSAAARDRAFCAHPYTNLKRHQSTGPLVITRGEGVHVYDEAGKAYIEGLAGLWCTALGFSEPRLIEAAARGLSPAAVLSLLRRQGAGADHRAGRAADRASPRCRCRRCSSPIPARRPTTPPIKLVWYYNNALGRPEKKKIISRQRAYHGVTVATASLTGLPANHRDFDLPIERILHTDCPHYWRYADAGESEEDFATRLADNLERLIVREGPDTIAAMFAEPVMGAGGVIVPPATYFAKIQPVLKRYDILLDRRRGDLRLRAHRQRAGAARPSASAPT